MACISHPLLEMDGTHEVEDQCNKEARGPVGVVQLSPATNPRLAAEDAEEASHSAQRASSVCSPRELSRKGVGLAEVRSSS